MFYLAWFAVLLGLTAGGTVGTYVAVARFGVLERLVAFGVRRGLKGLTLHDATAQHSEYIVTRIPGGALQHTVLASWPYFRSNPLYRSFGISYQRFFELGLRPGEACFSSFGPELSLHGCCHGPLASHILQNCCVPCNQKPTCTAGIQVQKLFIARQVLDKLGLFAVQLQGASVQFAEVTFPTWAAPFRIQLKGVQFTLKQRDMPEVSMDEGKRDCILQRMAVFKIAELNQLLKICNAQQQGTFLHCLPKLAWHT